MKCMNEDEDVNEEDDVNDDLSKGCAACDSLADHVNDDVKEKEDEDDVNEEDEDVNDDLSKGGAACDRRQQAKVPQKTKQDQGKPFDNCNDNDNDDNVTIIIKAKV